MEDNDIEVVVRKSYKIGNYLVVEEKKSMVCVYFESWRGTELLSSRGNWKSAVKLARLLEKTYELGRKDAQDEERDNCYYRY